MVIILQQNYKAPLENNKADKNYKIFYHFNLPFLFNLPPAPFFDKTGEYIIF